MTLKLGKGISMPDEAITETFGILAARGAGKSNSAAVMAEEMFAAQLPFVVIDPVGSWWGLRSSSTGTGPGLDVPLFGGKRGDVPLERTGGRLIADIVVEQRLSCILDLTEFDSEAAKKQFLLDFARRLYQKNEAPLHLFLEEADDYIPQQLRGGGSEKAVEPQLLRAFENLVRRGRGRGLGMTMITQRSASINKNVLTQVQTLIAMRTTGPQDRKAIEEWVKYNDQSQDILETLSSLADGEAWVWSPQFLKKTERVQFRRRHTFDSGSTPKMVAKGKAARLADVDVGKIREQMAETIKRAEQEDPKILKKRIAELERELKTAKPVNTNEVVQLRMQIAGLGVENKDLRECAHRYVDQLVVADATMVDALNAAKSLCEILQKTKFKTPVLPHPVAKTRAKYSEAIPAAVKAPARQRVQTSAQPIGGNGKLTGPQQRILNGLAWWEAIGVMQSEAIAVAMVTGYRNIRSGGFKNPRSELASMGLVEYPVPGLIALTDAGRELAEFPDVGVDGPSLRALVLDRLSRPQRRILQPLLDAHPESMEQSLLADAAGYTNIRSGGFKNPRSELASMGLVEYPQPGYVRARDILFPA